MRKQTTVSPMPHKLNLDYNQNLEARTPSSSKSGISTPKIKFNKTTISSKLKPEVIEQLIEQMIYEAEKDIFSEELQKKGETLNMYGLSRIQLEVQFYKSLWD